MRLLCMRLSNAAITRESARYLTITRPEGEPLCRGSDGNGRYLVRLRVLLSLEEAYISAVIMESGLAGWLVILS
jgi:hypothetical protein